MVTLRDAALRYAAHGWPVFPCHTPTPDGCSCRNPDCTSVGKHPRTMRGVHDATTDAEAIRRWWRMWPQANPAIRTGGPIVVLDVDPRAGGNESLDRLEYEHGELWTLCAHTGGGGLHFVFAAPRALKSRTGILPGIDVKGEGGYIIAPPSLHASGRRYQWVPDHPTAPQPMPGWLIDLIDPPIPVWTRRKYRDADLSPSRHYVEAAIVAECLKVAEAPEGERNIRLNNAAFALSRFVVQGAARPEPLWDALRIAARHAGLPAPEIDRTIRSAMRARGAVA